ncbi:unnamed protein product [Spirodela intermedia]|uniref:t-SNARE coiled-coil homology domain-containing protein n=1 Tax=Spirodela intermedia TaxID=51605 RepID=A0A7I8IS72_SPIIN|nr:unnamed protein product [Spirodela intermedia]CAA6660848.1 unnamed protein product [Spirodela intermedia]
MSVKSDHSFRDRTHEFFSIAERLKKSETKLDGSRSAVSIQSEFNKRASRIGLAIHQTSQKLSKLAMLAKKTGTYDDPAVEIQEMTAVIKQDITALNSAVVDLQLLCNTQYESGGLTGDTTSHSTTVVDSLKNRLMSTTKEFKEVLTLRTEKLKVHENRKQLFSRKDATNPFARQRPLAPLRGRMAPRLVLRPWSFFVNSRRHVNGETSSSTQPLMHQQLVPVRDEYMQSRAEALQSVESTIHELSSIFTQLATMVSQQGELAIRTWRTRWQTWRGPRALLKYLNGISSNRWLMIKIFFVLVVFLMIFLFFVA